VLPEGHFQTGFEFVAEQSHLRFVDNISVVPADFVDFYLRG
jgi:hypothetical protein